MAKDINLHKQEFILSLFLLQVFGEFMKNKQFAKISKIKFLFLYFSQHSHASTTNFVYK